MNTTHTPGPWKCDKSPVFGSWYVRQDPENWNGMGYQFICELPADKKGTHYGDMFAANARLIAAAPDMFEALTQILEASRPGQEMSLSDAIDALSDIWNAARVALSKAQVQS